MVATTLTSPDWYRISHLHPRLRPHVMVRMQITRGQPWYVLFNQATGRHHRVNKQAYELIGRMNGLHSIDEIWQVLLHQLKDDVPSQHDVVRVLGQLTDAGLIQAEVTPDVDQLVGHAQSRQAQERRSRVNPMVFRLGLFNPSQLLEKLAPLGRFLWSRWVQWSVGMGMLVVAWSMLLHAQEVAVYAQDFFLTPQYLTMAWLLYPFMKALHEAGHALALRRYGCEVPEVGVNFFLLVPMPYVDASAANQLVNRWQRAHISGAGIWVELMLAAMSGALWLTVEDGWFRQLCFVVCSLGAVSSLLFNGNPLMRLDGYYMLCDVLDLPNLAGRSNKLISRWGKQLALKLVRVKSMADEAGVAAADTLERWAMVIYAPASWVYRVLLVAWLTSWAADRAFWLGVLMIAWGAWSLVIKPFWSWLETFQVVSADAWDRMRVTSLLALIGLMLTLVLLLVPVPSAVVAEGLVWMPEHSQVRATVDGQIETVLVRTQQRVEKGDPLVTLKSLSLEAQKQVLEAQLAQQQAQYHTAFGVDSLSMQNAQAALDRDGAALDKLNEELQGQTLRAGVRGVFVLDRPSDLEGREVTKGDIIGHVMGDQGTVIRAVVPQSLVDDIRQRRAHVDVMLDEQPGKVWRAQWLGEVPAASNVLPAEGLADRLGGRVPTLTDEQSHIRPSEPLFVMDVVIPQSLPRAGGLARVKVHLQAQSLGQTWGKRLRQLLLRHFGTGNE